MLAAYFDYRTLSWINLDTQAHSEENEGAGSFAVTNTRLLRLCRSSAHCWMIRAVPQGLFFLFSDGISGCCHVYEISWRDHHGIMIAESPVDYRVRCLLDRLRGT